MAKVVFYRDPSDDPKRMVMIEIDGGSFKRTLANFDREFDQTPYEVVHIARPGDMKPCKKCPAHRENEFICNYCVMRPGWKVPEKCPIAEPVREEAERDRVTGALRTAWGRLRAAQGLVGSTEQQIRDLPTVLRNAKTKQETEEANVGRLQRQLKSIRKLIQTRLTRDARNPGRPKKEKSCESSSPST